MNGQTNGGKEYIPTMKLTPKLLVAGCSVSDYTHVDKVWGQYLAEKLDREYIHEGSGCGSNWRMWRKIFNHVNQNSISKDDIVIVQYTELIRREFWSPYQKQSRTLYGSNGKSFIVEKYNDSGSIIKFKMDAHKFSDHTSDEKKFFKLYTRFIDQEFELEQFFMMHNMFQGFMKDKGFKNLYFLKAGGYGPLKDSNDLIDFYKGNFIAAPNAFVNHLPNDNLHMDQKGHFLLSEDIFEFINTISQ